MDEDMDLDELLDEMTARVQDAVESAVGDQLEEAVTNAVQDMLPEALEECLADFEFVLAGGTVVRPRQRMKLLAPDQSKLLLCYGGLRVDGTTLVVQTRLSCWEAIAVYPTREEAVDALKKVNAAMQAHLEQLEL